MRRQSLLVLLPLLISGIAGYTTCDNGGFKNEKEECACPSFWNNNANRSDKGCTVIQCINGGYSLAPTPSADPTPSAGPTSSADAVSPADPTVCICPTGYMGKHCEAVSAFTPQSGIFTQTTASFTLVYVNLLSNYWGGLAFTQLQNALARIIDPVSSMNKWIITNDGAPKVLAETNDSTKYNFAPKSCVNVSDQLGRPRSPGTFQCYGAPFYQPIVAHIKNQTIRESAITIFTQHPASDTDFSKELITLAQSFDIRINVIFSDDQTFIRCTPGNISDLRTLTTKTGGIFVTAAQISDYSATGTIMDMVLQSHISYEPIVMSLADGGGNGAVMFNMNLPPKTYYVVAYGNDNNYIAPTSSCGGVPFNNQTAMRSSDSVIAYKIATYASVCSITFEKVNRVQVFASNMAVGPVSVKLFKSYVESTELDTSKIQPNKGNALFLSLHVENTGNLATSIAVTAASFIQGNSDPLNLEIAMRERTKPSTMEYVSNKTVKCLTTETAWIQLSLSGGLRPEDRYIPVFCQDVADTSTTPDQGQSWYNYEENYGRGGYEEAEDDSTTQAPLDPYPKSFILAYSDAVTQNQHNNFIVSSMLGGQRYYPYDNFGVLRFDVIYPPNDQTGKGPDFHSANDSMNLFNTMVYSVYPWDASISIAATTPDSSQVLVALTQLAKAANETSNPDRIYQNSLISMNLARLTNDTFDLSTIYPLINNNIKVVMFIDAEAMTKLAGLNMSSPKILNQVAALTSGHLIVCNQNDQQSYTNLLQSIYTSGPGQNLLFAKNFVGIQTPQLQGSIYLEQVKRDINVTITYSTNVQSLNGTAATLPIPGSILFAFIPMDYCNQSTVIAKLTQTPSSNFYSSTVNLRGSCNYTLNLQQAILYSGGDALLRVWAQATDLIDLQVDYKNLNNSEKPEGPDDYNGAIPVVSLRNVDSTVNDAVDATLEVTYLDCMGNKIALYDNHQTLLLTAKDKDGLLHYVPFFCTAPTSSSCQEGTENLYYAQYRGSNNESFVGTKTFVCQNTGREPKEGCNHQDKNGNFICGGSETPYKRGKAAMLIDCSSPVNSDLTYDLDISSTYEVAPFKCNCLGGSNAGPSCASTDCPIGNKQGGAVDAYYRTYTVVVVIDKSNGGFAQDFFTAAKSVVLPKAPDTLPSNIWQYQLFAACFNGEVVPRYIGPSAYYFTNAFTGLPSNFCNRSADEIDYDLTNIYSTAVASVGKQQRGLFVLYHELNNLKKIVDVTDLEKFIEISQQYQQQVYIFNTFDTSEGTVPSNRSDNLLSALLSTGGNIILADLQEIDDISQIKIKFFPTILGEMTSLNGHNMRVNPSFVVNVEKSESAYLIATSDDGKLNDIKAQFERLCGTKDDQWIYGYGVTCKVNGTAGTPVTITTTSNVTYSVVAFNTSSPLGVFITQRIDDKQTSVPVSYTTGGPTLAIFTSDEYNVTNNVDSAARDAKRQPNCTFRKTTVDVFGRLDPGFRFIQMHTTYLPSPVNVTKVFPFGVSSAVQCKNGRINAGLGQCDCLDANFWEGPDCSRPKCQNGGTLSPWGTACNCDTRYGGQFCEKDLNPDPTTSPPVASTTTPPGSSSTTA